MWTQRNSSNSVSGSCEDKPPRDGAASNSVELFAACYKCPDDLYIQQAVGHTNLASLHGATMLAQVPPTSQGGTDLARQRSPHSSGTAFPQSTDTTLFLCRSKTVCRRTVCSHVRIRLLSPAASRLKMDPNSSEERVKRRGYADGYGRLERVVRTSVFVAQLVRAFDCYLLR